MRRLVSLLLTRQSIYCYNLRSSAQFIDAVFVTAAPLDASSTMSHSLYRTICISVWIPVWAATLVDTTCQTYQLTI